MNILRYLCFPFLIASSRLTLLGDPEGKLLYRNSVNGIRGLSWQSPERSSVSVRNRPHSGGFELEG
jgi:hypothetical protein